jgi:DNA invertase Pin-like site-specific DNA recombinase
MFRSIQDGIDTSNPTGQFFFHVIRAFAELEHSLIKERTNTGLSIARARERTGGRKPLFMTYQYY